MQHLLSRARKPLLICVWLLAALGLTFSAQNPASNAAKGYAQSVAISATGVYVTLRTINAVLSTAQEAELSGQFIVGGSVQPLKVLEPIDDTIERVAGVVFIVMVASSLFSVAAQPLGILGCALILVGSSTLLLAKSPNLQSLGRKSAMIGAVIGIVFPLAFALGGVVSDQLTKSAWVENEQIVQRITAPLAVETAQLPSKAPETGWLQSLRNSGQQASDSLQNYSRITASLFAEADVLIHSYLQLLAIFLIKILVLPLLLFAGAWGVLRSLSRS